ncbi:lysophospholipid acyltransferase family protein [Humitalea sp. 24SJ18S-53]|uniref:lysophospholipid acyltransferase family protein n=1 Tax=Humitalea sp. 24SJ18S-53 TaxID=3422307 RepID=UPI003D66A61D
MILLRSTVFNALFYPMTAGLAFAGTMVLLGSPRRTYAVMNYWARAVIVLMRVVCGIRLVVTGTEHLPRGGALIVSNHQSALDTIVWLMLVDTPIYVMKKELMNIPGYGWMARHTGMVPVDRSGGGPALKQMLRAASAAAARGGQVVIFPEGTRAPPRTPLPWQPGVTALAGVITPIIPVATDSGRCWGRRAFLKRPGTITISILPPLPTGLPRAQTVRLLEATVRAETERLEALPDAA